MFPRLPAPSWLACAVLVLGLLGRPARAAWPLPATSPEKAGFSAGRLERLDAWCADQVSSGRYSGLTVVLARDGRIVEWRSFGFRDRAQGVRMENNDVHAIASLTKLVTTVAALSLVEEGRLTLREPLARHWPAFDKVQVLAGGTADAPVVVPAVQPITVHHLLTHTAGFYGGANPAEAPVLAELWRRDPVVPQTLAEVADRLARLPLQAQPGSAWIYGPSTDLLGALVERVSGRPLGEFLAERIFRPLRMRDTGFEVPESARARQVWMDIRQPDGTLQSEAPRPRQGPWPSGGGGLYSTLGDYLRFAQMLLNRGELEGVRILSPKMVALMTQDHLHGLAKPTKIYPVSDGFGYGVEVRTDVARSGWLGTEGTYGWNGATTAYCSIDPREGVVAMIWAQHRPNAEFELYERFNNLVYQALVQTR